MTVTVSSAGPYVERTVPQLFYPGEIIYGGFSAAVSNIDGNILLFAAAGNGVKVARVQPDKYTDRTQVSKLQYQVTSETHLPTHTSTPTGLVQPGPPPLLPQHRLLPTYSPSLYAPSPTLLVTATTSPRVAVAGTFSTLPTSVPGWQSTSMVSRTTHFGYDIR